ncbi:MAG: hypothetical protein BGO83_18885 [Devosia sp. 66-14]|nr:MAG: hypothetical protein ABS47_10265 [Devosia sp. SCN 66-27]OJX22839.1 MAG: hypothetical protein BGO83_18885 [Devosia sp. 66-14]
MGDRLALEIREDALRERKSKTIVRGLPVLLSLLVLSTASIPVVGGETRGTSITSETPIGEILDLAKPRLGLADPESVKLLVNLYVRATTPGQLTWEDAGVTYIRDYTQQSLLWLYLRETFQRMGLPEPAEDKATIDRLADVLEYAYRIEIDPRSEAIYLPVNVNVGLVGEMAFGRKSGIIVRFEPTVSVNLSEEAADISTVDGLPPQLKFGFGKLDHIEVVTSGIPKEEIDAYLADIERRNPGETYDNITKGPRYIHGYNGRLSCNYVQKRAGDGFAVVDAWDCSFRLDSRQIMDAS